VLDEPAEDPNKPQVFIGRLKLTDPVLVYYQAPPPSTAGSSW
jgi:hypothetical protein